MKISTRGRYGVRLMLELTKNYGNGPLSVTEISKRQKIPTKYIEQLVIPLKNSRLVQSVRGPKGGHMLAKSPKEINLWEILNLLESKFTLVDCVVQKETCQECEHCLIRPIWAAAYKKLKKFFQETSLHDVLSGKEIGKGLVESRPLELQ